MNDEKTLRVLGIPGSLRRGSYNRALVLAARELAPTGMDISLADLSDIPLFDADVEAEGDPAPVRELKSAVAEADALLIATPEYQHSVPGVLNNALDWASRPPGDSPLGGKVVAIAGATPGRGGTARAQAAQRQVLVYNGCVAVPAPEVQVYGADDKFDDELRLTDETARELLADLLVRLSRLARSLAQ